MGRRGQGAANPTYPGLAQRRQSVGIKIFTRFDFGKASGLRSSDGQLPRAGAQFEPHPFEDDLPRTFDPDHQTRLPVGNDVSDPIRSPDATLIDTVARLQLDMEEMRSASMGNQTLGGRTSPGLLRQVAFTPTKVPKFAGVTSYEQYRQVFDAIVMTNGWDDAKAALQLLSHLEGNALYINTCSIGWGTDCTLRVAGPAGGLSPPVREDDPEIRGEPVSIFAIALETLAVKAFGDMGHTARLRIIRDRFMIVVICADIWTVWHRRLPSGILLIIAGYGRVMSILALRGSVSQDPRELYRSILWMMWEMAETTG